MIADDDDGEELGDADPDSRARTHLANERTFLAWFRTGFTMIALGVAASQFLGTQDPGSLPFVRLLSAASVGGGMLLGGGGYVRYRVAREQISALRFRPAGRSIGYSVALALIVGVVALGFVLLVTPR